MTPGPRAMTPEPRECPFCGGKAKLVNFDVHKTCVGFEWIECESCAVMVEIENAGLSGEDCRGQLVAAWNRRPPDRLREVARVFDVAVSAVFNAFDEESMDPITQAQARRIAVAAIRKLESAAGGDNDGH